MIRNGCFHSILGELPNDVRTYFSKLNLVDLSFYKEAFAILCNV